MAHYLLITMAREYTHIPRFCKATGRKTLSHGAGWPSQLPNATQITHTTFGFFPNFCVCSWHFALDFLQICKTPIPVIEASSKRQFTNVSVYLGTYPWPCSAFGWDVPTSLATYSWELAVGGCGPPDPAGGAPETRRAIRRWTYEDDVSCALPGPGG